MSGGEMDYKLPGNPGVVGAGTIINRLRDYSASTEVAVQASATAAVVHSNLAVAFELRTANMIALAQLGLIVEADGVELDEELARIENRMKAQS